WHHSRAAPKSAPYRRTTSTTAARATRPTAPRVIDSRRQAQFVRRRRGPRVVPAKNPAKVRRRLRFPLSETSTRRRTCVRIMASTDRKPQENALARSLGPPDALPRYVTTAESCAPVWCVQAWQTQSGPSRFNRAEPDSIGHDRVQLGAIVLHDVDAFTNHVLMYFLVILLSDQCVLPRDQQGNHTFALMITKCHLEPNHTLNEYAFKSYSPNRLSFSR
ncbi:hypothetical protein JG687_00012900, partial [Phytophthora cactorum]